MTHPVSVWFAVLMFVIGMAVMFVGSCLLHLWRCRVTKREIKLLNAIKYLLVVRDIKCLSPLCGHGTVDTSCAYHEVRRAIGEYEGEGEYAPGT